MTNSTFFWFANQLIEPRKQFLGKIFVQRPHVIKYESLMNTKNKRLLISIAKFIKVIYAFLKENTTER